jgi:hypothetical protein
VGADATGQASKLKRTLKLAERGEEEISHRKGEEILSRQGIDAPTHVTVRNRVAVDDLSAAASEERRRSTKAVSE